MPEERIESCADDYAQANAGWQALLQPHLADGRSGGRSGGASGGRSGDPSGSGLQIVFAPAAGALGEIRDFLQASGLAEAVVEAVNEWVALPIALPASFVACGEADAFYDPEERQVVICYELVQSFERMILVQ